MKKALRKLRRQIKYLRRRARSLREHKHMRRWKQVRREITRDQKKIEIVKARNREGVDVSWGRPSPESLKEAGKSFICLYLNDIDGFGATKEDIHKYHSAGLDIVLIFEKGADDAGQGHAKGVQHARLAHHEAVKLDAPKGTVVFFAADFEAHGPECAPYYVGVREELHRLGSKIRPGGYGDRDLMEYLNKHDLIVAEFQTYAWSHHEWAHESHLRQVLINLPGNELKIGGSTVDYCKSIAVDFGQWRTKVNA